MRKKNIHIAILTNFQFLDSLFTTWKNHLEVLNKNFNKIYIINTEHLQFFPRNIKYNLKNKEFKKYKNIKILNIKTVQEIENLNLKNEFLIINNFGKSFKELKIHFLIKRLNIKQIQITTVGNEQYSSKVSYKRFFKKISFFFEKKFFPFFTNFLAFINIINQLEVRFISNSNILKNIYKNPLKKFLYEKEFFFSKKLVLVNSTAYDFYKNKKSKISNDYIVHIDVALNYYHKTNVRGKLSSYNYNQHYMYLNIFLNSLSKYLKKKVIVCIHPAYNLKEHQKKFKQFKVYKFKTREFIRKAYLVTFFDSTTILDAVILKKKIIGIISKFMSRNDVLRQYAWSNNLNCIKQVLDKNYLFNKNDIKKLKTHNKGMYKNYIQTYLKRDSNEMGIDQIVRYLKINFND